MDIFISWSGDRARGLAKALRDWLKCVIQTASPWMSDEDIGPGTRWGIELARQLEHTNFGILCLTKESLSSPWLLFEAGALAKALTESRVCPVLLDVDLGDLPPPLAQFNGVQATEQDSFSWYDQLTAPPFLPRVRHSRNLMMIFSVARSRNGGQT